MAEFTEGYCNVCDAERELLLTAPWQDNNCKQCGSTDVERSQEQLE